MAKKYEVHVTVLSRLFSVSDMPSWMYKYDHGTNLHTMYVDMYVPKKSLKSVRNYFRKKKILLRISKPKLVI